MLTDVKQSAQSRLLVFIRLKQVLQSEPDIFVHENVTNFPLDILSSIMGY